MEGKRKEVLGSEYEEKEGVFWEEKMGSVEWGCVGKKREISVCFLHIHIFCEYLI